MSCLADSENSRSLRMKAMASEISLGSLSGPKMTTARTTSATSLMGPMSNNTVKLPYATRTAVPGCAEDRIAPE
jgi:hypothetical protein